jgi:formate-dependent nitrite reductase membrane component NrfD
MVPLAEAEHFVRAPNWTWYILFYFFLAGLSGGSYVLASLFRLRGGAADEAAARVGYYVAFLTLLGCPGLLTLDLGQPMRFWHMLVNTTPGDRGPIVKYWSPMSVGAWALVAYGVFATVSFFGALAADGVVPARWLARLLGGVLGKVWSLLGMLVGLFVAGYTGVLLAVSNQPVWSDTWSLGALFLASGLAGSAALLGWLVRFRREARERAGALVRGERFFVVLELALIVLFAVTLIQAGTLGRAFGFPWLLLWVFAALAGLLPWLRRAAARVATTPEGTTHTVAPGLVLTVVVLVGVLALRAAVIFSAQ